MHRLHDFPGIGDIAGQIQDYRSFGICLLNDKTGNRVAIAAENNRGNVGHTNNSIFNRFIIGDGKKPMNWRSFIECLETTGLCSLVEDILQHMNTREQGNMKNCDSVRIVITPFATLSRMGVQ